MVRDLDLLAPQALDGRRLEVVAEGLPLFGSMQLAIDATLVILLHCVNTIPPIQQNRTKNGYGNGYMKTMATVNGYENKCATNYSIITNNNWNDAYNVQLTKHDTNDDVDTMHLHFDGRVAYMH